mmetsp:Transcript_33158/g.58489  ORF Transcript_33158/g.58489 Transcript_33158/m.58489 type:complete len:360 (+) Transcript_33158:53-1132(+)
MRSTTFLLACLAFTGDGRRLQATANPSDDQIQSHKAEGETSVSNGEDAESSARNALATLLQAGIPTAGWQMPLASSNSMRLSQPGHNVLHPAAIGTTRSSAAEMKFKKRGLLGRPKNVKGRGIWKGGRKVFGGLKRKKKSLDHFQQARRKITHKRAVAQKDVVKPALDWGWQRERYYEQKSWENLPWLVYARVRLPRSGIKDPVMDHLYEWFHVGHITLDEDSDISPHDAAWVQKQVINDWVLHLEPLMRRGSCSWDLGVAPPSNEDVANVRILEQYLDSSKIPATGLEARRQIGAHCGWLPRRNENDGNFYISPADYNPALIPIPMVDYSKVDRNRVGKAGKMMGSKSKAPSQGKVKR